MDKQNWQKIKKIFETASGLTGEERRKFLDKECGGDAERRSEVEKLLHSFEEADTSFLEEPAEKEVVSQLLENETKAMNVTTGEVRPDVFVAGTVLDNRYRILGLIGRGGMGEVFKAEDLKLGQTVALKFLPDKLTKDKNARKRFLDEVKNARRVGHPNVCKVFDIGEIGGRMFLSMEFIEGDDLSQLLNRIGRLPSERAIEISRQICLGLNEIHEAGILHRDLKPANVIIDSRGKARITDFGIAGIEEDIQDKNEIVGTPAYMSPEQITGKEVTKKSDIYSLGLLIYEIFTGKQAVKGDSINEIIEIHQSQTPTNPSEFVENINPLVEKIINRCLEKQPEDRPKSALQVALALPGGNPLEAAIAAGETPSPEMIAAVPKKGALQPKIALALLLLLIAGFISISVLHQYFKSYNITPLEKSPEILAERAKTITRNLGYTQPPADIKYGFDLDNGFLRYAAENQSIKNVAERLRAGQPYQIYFMYRQSPLPLEPWQNVLISESDPPLTVSEMINIRLDTRGRLIRFNAVPDQAVEKSNKNSGTTDWKKLFDEAELDINNFRQTEPQWIPPIFADEKTAWEGTLADFQDIPIRIEAAALDGKPVYFEIVNPWDKPAGQQKTVNSSRRIGDIISFIVFFLVLVSAVLLARHNIKTGRSDLKGGAKLAAFCFLSFCFLNLLIADHVWSISGEMTIFGRILGDALYYAMLIGLLYIALEPFARRYWSELLISWNRLLTGDFSDPMIGRDILIGGVVGVGLTLIMPYSANLISSYIFGIGDNVSAQFFKSPLNGWTGTLGQLFGAPIFPVLYGLILLFLLVLFFVIFKNKKISVVLVFFLLFINDAPTVLEYHWTFIIGFFISDLIFVFVLIRFGLLAVILAVFYQGLSNSFLQSFNVSSYLFPGTVIVFIFAFGLAIFGFYTATAGKSVFSRGLLDDNQR